VAYTEVLLPPTAPAELSNREILWNQVEASEKRKDAQLAREFNFALPRELTLEQNIALAKDFVNEAFVKEGMIADLCIHNDKQKDGESQPHAHVMLTMRAVTSDGFGPKIRAWNERALLGVWREAWADMANRHLALHGHDVRIDHRTLLEQGIALEPQSKIGPVVVKDRLARLEDHQRIARENGEKLFLEPEIALKALTRQQSTFTHQDLARFVNRHTVDAEQFSLVFDKVKGCEGIVALGLDDKGRERFTTQDLLSLESRMMEQAASLSHTVSHGVREDIQAQALAEKRLTGEQQMAFDHLLSEGRLKCVIGFAGTGKSYLLGATRAAWEQAGFTVSGVTLSGIAAENLEGSSGIVSRTFASRSYYWDKGEQTLSPKDVLVVDEAGMLPSRHMARILEEASSSGAKVVLVGDPQQLQAIEAGAAFRAIVEREPFVELTDIRRQQVEWQQEATKALARGRVEEAVSRYDQHSHVHAFQTMAVAKQSLVELWNDARLSDPDKTQTMLAYTRSDVLELNQLARGLRKDNGELKEDILFSTERGERTLAVGERVYFLKNDRSLGVMNGTLGTIEKLSDQSGELVIRLDADRGASRGEGSRAVSFTMDRYHHLDYGYAATIHKAQGVTVDRSYVLASQYLDAHSSYVAMSRHRVSVDLFYSKDVFLGKKALVKTLGRERAKDVSVDYLSRPEERFAGLRGIEVSVGRGFGADSTREPSFFGPGEKAPDFSVVKDQGVIPDRAHQQAALRAFVEKTRLERASRGLQSESPGAGSRSQERDFSSFKARFEEKHPERAAALRHAMTPAQEKRAMESIERLTYLEHVIEKGGRTRQLAEDHLQSLVKKISRQPETMQYLRERDVGLEKKVVEMAKELDRDRGYEREL
jgi:Ti-type conjugative transfer relaxase TraA